jgi:uncharacterized membrane-anchored protein YjiN (DUF445 family)
MDTTPDISIDNANLTPIKKYFDYQGHDRDEDFEFMAGWAEERQFKTPEDMYIELKNIEQRLGTANISEDRINKIKNYIKARARMDLAWKEMMSMERGNV